MNVNKSLPPPHPPAPRVPFWLRPVWWVLLSLLSSLVLMLSG